MQSKKNTENKFQIISLQKRKRVIFLSVCYDNKIGYDRYWNMSKLVMKIEVKRFFQIKFVVP